MSITDSATQAPMAVYQDYLEKNILAYQYSIAAGKPFFYPRLVCPFSGTTDFEWRVSAGRGTVYSQTNLFPRDLPSYAVVLVDLDEGYRMMSRVVDAAAEEVAIGARVAVAIRKGETGDACPFFVLEDRA